MKRSINPYSKKITQDDSLPAARAMLHATGMKKSDFSRAQIGIVSTGFDGNPCNMHLNGFAEKIKGSVNSHPELYGLVFHTIGVSDGISNGTSGMRYSLPSREIIADSIETVAQAQFYDALIPVVGCDKNMPGAMIALGRLNRPSILVYGGTVKKGSWKGKDLNIVSAFEAYGEKLKGTIAAVDYEGIIENSIPGAGACGGMYTANTMAAAIECMGMSLPYSSSSPALSPEKENELSLLGPAIHNLLKEDIRPRDIITREAFLNAIKLIMILGGSTNAVIHLLAMARSVRVALTLDDFQRVSDQTPFLADLKPSGKYLMEDLHFAGGIPAVMKYLASEGILDDSLPTITGKTHKQNLKDLPGLEEGQRIIMPVEKPLKSDGHIRILKGNLAEEGAVAKITGKEGIRFSGPARIYEDEFEAIRGIENEVKKGDVIVIRNCGPKGAPGMPEMLKPTGAIVGAGLGKEVALITDGRFSGGSHGFVVGHISPEAYSGGLLAWIQNGDIIHIDAEKNSLKVDLDETEIAKRKLNSVLPNPKPASGMLAKYRKLAGSASQGCVTDED